MSLLEVTSTCLHMHFAFYSLLLSLAVAQEMSKHVEGKKHLRVLASNAASLRHERQSVFVRNFCHGTSEAKLREFFDQFGTVDKVIMDKSVRFFLCFVFLISALSPVKILSCHEWFCVGFSVALS